MSEEVLLTLSFIGLRMEALLVFELPLLEDADATSAVASRPISLAGNSQGVVLELNFISLPPSDKCKML
ncbi:hypothetical protein Patl1_07108 [Pistacia atlantica]|uniref:Uncharacterized protein n=1 Tax=Pistacia atlantica TaxID=434234 RepID=A0ACC1ABZ4_9ROSI|nr:hypothetical protein Patl1_07108 [Pistacia atlantica]